VSVALFAGTFDPITNGHLDLLTRGLAIFDKIIISVAERRDKGVLFTLEERVELIKKVAGDHERVEVDHFEGLLVEYAKRKGVSVVVRGLRAVSDFEYEFQMALMNRRLSESLETVFLMPSEQFTYLNSTVVKEIARNGGDVSGLVPAEVARALAGKARE